MKNINKEEGGFITKFLKEGKQLPDSYRYSFLLRQRRNTSSPMIEKRGERICSQKKMVI
jgi:hypothetical protein